MLALLSVSDKRGIVPFAQSLVKLGFSIISTGGTLQALQAAGVPAQKVSDYTGMPEILGGRLKTLHPKIHGGILARPDLDSDRAELDRHQLRPIFLVAVNLYPFRETVDSGASFAEAIEQIDVGGPAMVRAAAKNFAHVTVVVDPADYDAVLLELQTGSVRESTRRELSRKAFAHTAAYDAAIAAYLFSEAGELFPESLMLSYEKAQPLRYGENPHQLASFYREPTRSSGITLAQSQVLQGNELSYNNLLDLDAALSLLLEFADRPCACIIKHNSPCGVAQGDSLESAYRAAREVDEVSAFGGIVALNREVDAATAKALAETFLEAVLAPSYAVQASEILAAKKNLRLLAAGPALVDARPRPGLQLRSILGGLLVQQADALEPPSEWKVVTARQPSEKELAAMRFAWRVCKHVKSNAIVFSHADRLLAVGAGQTSRVDSVKIAVGRGGPRLRGSAVASDAFFPFRDGLDEAARAGATCVVQPGGSVRDGEVIDAANEHGMAMVFTGVRHFRH
ncbi:MAG TPA: bifunctional phosphoribosylaminoimidazolecarboxamide formyltransferase/IMP cyclohydrolase [Myxococcaceae bacterium]|nr:bifunctional phosphoribosylaminoimidazolecarboxamide formyltransferase/IMP cyclohydrolase [Myxococcaceae bacterium]